MTSTRRRACIDRMDGLSGPFFIAAALLVLAGVPKITEPGDTVRAIRSVGLRTNSLSVRVLAVLEVVVGLAVISFGGPLPAALLTLLYAGFAGFIVLAIRRGGAIASCGCFGKTDTPPTYAHLVLNLSAVGLGIAALLAPPGGLVDIIGDQPAFGVPFVGFVALGAWLGYVTLALLPQLNASRSKT